jgi:hypothetical protein
VPICGFIKGTDKFPIQKCAIFRKFKEIKELRGGILMYVAQAIPPIDAEIAGKGHLWTETNYNYWLYRLQRPHLLSDGYHDEISRDNKVSWT